MMSGYLTLVRHIFSHKNTLRQRERERALRHAVIRGGSICEAEVLKQLARIRKKHNLEISEVLVSGFCSVLISHVDLSCGSQLGFKYTWVGAGAMPAALCVQHQPFKHFTLEDMCITFG